MPIRSFRKSHTQILLLVLAMALSGCGGGGGSGGSGVTATSSTSQDSGSSGSGNNSSPPQVNIPPTIGGTPASTATAGNWYSFRPWASDADGDNLSFSISNKPSWASFNTSSGHLNGTPSQASTHNNIVIRVSDGSSTVSLPAFRITVQSPQVYIPPTVANTPPTIGGTPASTVTAGNWYSFLPWASDADGDNLSFSISNKPSWASFNTGTGRLSGTPTQAGTHNNIVIRVSDGSSTVSLPGFSINVSASTGSFNVSWTAPTTRSDGTPMSLSDIDGYRIYYGTSRGNYTQQVNITNGAATSRTVNNLPVGQYYLVMTTYDQDGRESAQSPEISKQAN